MHLALATLLAGLAAGAVLAVVSFATTRPTSERAAETERWIVAHAPRFLRPTLRTLDLRVLGGAVVAVMFVITLVTALGVAWVLDTVGEERGVARWDRSAAEWSSDHVSEGATRILGVVTELGGTRVLFSIAAVVAVVDLVRRRRIVVPLYLAAVAIGVVLVNNGVKLWVDRERPDLDQLVGWSGASFPSGHAAAAAACWAGIMLVLTRHGGRRTRVLGGVVAVLLAVTVAVTRVLLGVHWLTDVVAGVLVGWGWFLVVSVAFGDRLAPRPSGGRDVGADVGDATTTGRADARELETT